MRGRENKIGRGQDAWRDKRCIVGVPNNDVTVAETGIEGRQIGWG